MRYALLALAVLAVACLFAGCTHQDKDAEMKAWGTTVQLDLPVNVSRTIIPTGATFTFTPEGDEKYVTVQTWQVFNSMAGHKDANSYAAPDAPLTFSSGAVMEQGDSVLGPYSHVVAPDAQLDLVRENGSVESYLLPVRDGSVKG